MTLEALLTRPLRSKPDVTRLLGGVFLRNFPETHALFATSGWSKLEVGTVSSEIALV